MKRKSWTEMLDHWKGHDAQWSDIDLRKDPKGLNNVCITGAPSWLNEYHDRIQKKVYRSLMAGVPAPVSGSRALDIGCGTGRWCYFLTKQGFQTTGIDLQAQVIESNRKRFPEIEFFNTPIQDFQSPQLFDLISSVTVIQHNPYEQQARIVQKFASWLKAGGYLVVLENIAFQAPTVFPNSVERWKELFAENGFQCLKTIKYDFSVFSRIREMPSQLLRRNPTPSSPSVATSSEIKTKTAPSSTKRLLVHFADWASVSLDSLAEPVLISSRLPLPSQHCGFLFQKR